MDEKGEDKKDQAADASSALTSLQQLLSAGVNDENVTNTNQSLIDLLGGAMANSSSPVNNHSPKVI